jgi:hypothetical protein
MTTPRLKALDVEALTYLQGPSPGSHPQPALRSAPSPGKSLWTGALGMLLARVLRVARPSGSRPAG